MVVIKTSDLQETVWTAIEGMKTNEKTLYWSVQSNSGNVIAAGLTEEGATLIAAAPRLLNFFSMLKNSPASIDAERVLSSAGIKLE